MSVKTGQSWSAHTLSTFPGTQLGPTAFLGFTMLSARLTSCSGKVSTQEPAAGGAGESEQDVFASKQFSSSANEAFVLVGMAAVGMDRFPRSGPPLSSCRPAWRS